MGPGLLPKRIGTSYAVKFTLALVVLLGIVGGFGYFIYDTTGAAIEEDTRAELRNEASIQTQYIDGWFRTTAGQMESIRRTNAFRNENDRVMTSRLTELAEQEAIAGAYYVNTTTDRVVVYGGSQSGFRDDSRDVQPSLSTHVQSALDAAPEANVVTTTAFRLESGQPVLALVSRMPGSIHDSHEETIIVSVVDLRALSRVVLGDANTVRVLDDRGKVVLAQDPSVLLTDDSVGSQPLDGSSGYTGAVNGSGNELAVGYASATTQPWTTTTRVPRASAFALQQTVQRQLGAMLAVVVLGMVVFGLTLGRNTVRSISRLSASADRLQDGDLETPVESSRADELGDLARGFDEMRRSLKEQIEEARAARRTAEAARQESEQFSRQLRETADEYGTVMQSCADGDLTRRLDPDTESEAMSTVATSFNAMLDDIEETVRSSKQFAAQVDDASQTAAESVAEVKDASEQVTESVQEISIGAERQSDTLGTVASEMEDLSTTTEEIAASSNEVADLAERTAVTGERGQNAAEDAIEGLREIEAGSETAVDEIEALEAEVEQVDELIEFVSGLAKETNMLALNANIEASRGGGEGDATGFGVVAEQVKDLAQETKNATEDIERRLERIAEQTERASQQVQRTAARIDADAESIEQAITALDEVAAYAQETNEGVQEISAATEQQAATTEEVVAAVEDAAGIAAQTTEETETVAAAAEEQTANVTAVSETVEQLSHRAASLSEMLRGFDVDDAGTAAPNPGQIQAGDD
ncbi:methyl-accepting chemotaxis protein [Haloarchaeobius iranensis]|uniref:Methyl-accepting chemotaxis protein n=1 Tax=Haloarchaeobius iranensis TaxID=996166 RepID=A0A1H0AHF1_9EURY|nr:methyl-accepting chemotaxis protein [Haloarchaeobius iranensis]SDN32771.1 methyl-accepting chemotaxis protein [Haloarchaeobius iranensis]